MRIFEQYCVKTNSGPALFGPMDQQECPEGALLVVAPRISDASLGLLHDLLERSGVQSRAVVHAHAEAGHEAMMLRLTTSCTAAQRLQWMEKSELDLGWRCHKWPWQTPRLAAFDMDSTLITMEVIDELAKEAGVGEEVAAITEAAMRGELDFNASLLKRVATLKGQPFAIIERVKQRVQLNDGVAEFSMAAQRANTATVLLSGGFVPFADMVQERLHFTAAHANFLRIENGLLDGSVTGDIVNADRKAAFLNHYIEQLDIRREDCIAVGDGANDALMLQQSGLGVAFHAKPKLRQVADLVLDHSDMRALIALFYQAR